MKKWLLGLLTAMMAVSLAACTPTTDKQKETKSAEVPIKEELENIDVSDIRFTRQRRMLKLVILGILILVSILIVIITWGIYTILD